jgi:hypothetical protein
MSYLGFSIGNGLNFIKPHIECEDRKCKTNLHLNSSLLTDLFLRVKYSNHFALDITTNNDWQMPEYTIILLTSELIEGIFYIKPQPYSNYISIGIGYSFWLYPFNKEWNNLYKGKGPSFKIGSCFKIYKHIVCKIEYGLSFPKNKSYVEQTILIGDQIVATGRYIPFFQTYITNAIRILLTFNLF